jgi:hypothetical protein
MCSGAPLNSCSNQGVCECTPTPSDGVTGGITACGGSASRTQRCACLDGFSGVDCSETCGADASGAVCSGSQRGHCTTTESGALACACQEGWSGDLCETPLCPGTPECGGESRGTCERSSSSASCVCSPGFLGEACEDLLCPSSTDGVECSGYGTCELDATGGVPRCDCTYGWTGDDCATNAGMASFVYSASVGGGLLAFGVLLAIGLYCWRASRTGQFVGPAEAYRQRQWARASTTYGMGTAVAVHTPKRVAIHPVWQAAAKNGGVRARVGPGM